MVHDPAGCKPLALSGSVGNSRAMRRLLVFFARVGDLVIFTPVIRHLARDAEVDLLVRPWGGPLLGGQPGVAAVHTLRNPNRGGLLGRLLDGGERTRVAQALAARGFDEIITFKGENPDVMRWIEGWRGGATLRHISRSIPDAPRHNVDANRHALAFGGFSTDGFDPVPRLEVAHERLAAARARLAPLGSRVLAVQAGSSLTHRWFRRQPNLKGLSPAQWSGFLARLLDEGHIDAAVLHGSAPEGREARAIQAALEPRWRGRVHDWTGQVPLGELPAVLAASSATVSVDTGPAHIAAAVGCPLLVIFGPTDPAVFAPRGPQRVEVLLGSAPCQFCHGTKQFKRCRANICLTPMTGETLMAGWRRLQAPAGVA
jgi:heptosyltransferase-2/heptosyltransferase-3